MNHRTQTHSGCLGNSRPVASQQDLLQIIKRDRRQLCAECQQISGIYCVDCERAIRGRAGPFVGT